MKYIRTKDGIFEYALDSEAFDGVYTTAMGINHLILYKEIVKQADTIEELCDAIIYFEDDGKPETTKYFGNMITFKDKIEFLKKMGHKDFKLGIWTDKGLIYVSKMNENGELELI